MKRVHLELGGNSALVVFDDVDIERATSAGAFGSFMHSGQICMASSRHLVHSSIAERYTQRLAEKARALVVADPAVNPAAMIGPLIDERQRDAVHKIVTDTTGTAQLGAPNGKGAVTKNATTGVLSPSTAFYNSAPFGRYVYNVIPTSQVGGTGVSRMFVGGGSPTCNAAGRPIVQKFGFALISAASGSLVCGSTSVTGAYTP